MQDEYEDIGTEDNTRQEQEEEDARQKEIEDERIDGQRLREELAERTRVILSCSAKAKCRVYNSTVSNLKSLRY